MQKSFSDILEKSRNSLDGLAGKLALFYLFVLVVMVAGEFIPFISIVIGFLTMYWVQIVAKKIYKLDGYQTDKLNFFSSDILVPKSNYVKSIIILVLIELACLIPVFIISFILIGKTTFAFLFNSIVSNPQTANDALSIVSGGIASLGSIILVIILMIIISVIVTLPFTYSMEAIFLDDLSATDAIKTSWKIVKNNVKTTACYYGYSIIMSILTVLTLGIGYIFFMPKVVQLGMTIYGELRD